GIRDFHVTGVQTCALPISAIIDDCVALFLVNNGVPGLQVQSYQTQDGSRAGELILNQAPGTLLTPLGTEAIERATAIASICACEIGRASCREREECTVESG